MDLQTVPEDIQNIMRAVLLLLGDKGKTVEKWEDIRKSAFPTNLRNPDVKKRIVKFVPSSVEDSVKFRAKELVKGLSKDSLKYDSAIPFLLWAQGVVDE